MSDANVNKIDLILATLQKGPMSRADLVAAIGTTPNALASYFTSLRLAAKFSPEKVMCPVIGEGNMIHLATYGEFEESQKVTAKPKAVKTPQEAFVLCEKALARAQKLVDTDPGDTTPLGKAITKRNKLNVEIAKYELEAATARLAEAQEVESTQGSEPVVEAEEVME